MQVFRDIKEASRFLSGGAALTIGSYDGYHVGHAVIVKELCAIAKQSGLKSVLITFAPHPQQIVAPDTAPKLLTTTAEKLALLEQTELDAAVIINFDQQFASIRAEDFLKEYLVERFHSRHVVIGYNHAFGHRREGNVDFLKSNARNHNYQVTILEPVILAGEAVHSSRVRAAVHDGEFDNVLTMLGHGLVLTGEVVRSKGLGAKLGYPTINVKLPPEKIVPPPGVYAACTIIDDVRYDGMMYVGESRQQFAFEVNLFDFSGDLYSRTVQVYPTKYVRKSIRFSSQAELVKQITEDEKKIRNISKPS